MRLNDRVLIALIVIGLGLIVIILSIAMVALISKNYKSTFPRENDVCYIKILKRYAILRNLVY